MFDFACNGFGYGGNFLFTIFFWIVLVVVAVGFVAWLLQRQRNTTAVSSGPAFGSPSDSAIEILKRRYASGEISRAEYESMKADIEA